MVVIRLARSGSKKKPFYEVVVADSRAPRDGRFVEKIGFYNPMARGQEVFLHLLVNKYQDWVKKGAQPSLRVSSLYSLYLKNGSKDITDRLPKIDRRPIDINDKPAKPKPKVIEVPEEDDTETTKEKVVSEGSVVE